MDNIVQRVLSGDRRALARMLSRIENERPGSHAELAELYPHTGRAWVIGITGAPGTGKSSLVTSLARAYRERGLTLGILAVDPTSPFSGGAILGDRIRMRDLSGDPDIFIRSMATRGSLGGLARTTRDAVRAMDAAGFDRIIVETVGAGQSEVDIVRLAYTTVVVEAPGMGDDVQAIKAGILEIADVLVVNKADRAGASQTLRALRAMLELGHPAARDQMQRHHGEWLPQDSTPEAKDHAAEEAWIPPLIQTIATQNEGIEPLLDAIEAHAAYLKESGMMSRLLSQTIEMELMDRLQEALLRRWSQETPPERFRAIMQQVQDRQLDPNQAVEQLLIHPTL